MLFRVVMFSFCIHAVALGQMSAPAVPPKAGATRSTPLPPSKTPPARPAVQTARPASNSSDARSQFAEARAVYEAGKYSEAVSLFNRMLRQYPSNEPALIFMAKSLFKLDRSPEAYQFFNRVRLQSLDIETSYEYGLSFFWMRNYTGALAAFQRVPDGHALADLANYYGGISALKLKRLIEAEAMMERAVVLPEKLGASRKLYIKHIQDLKLLYEKEGLAAERTQEQTRLRNRKRKQNTLKSKRDTTGPTSASKIDYPGFQDISKAATIGGRYSNRLYDMHGYGENTSDTRAYYFDFIVEPTLALSSRSDRKDTTLGLELNLHAEEQTRQGYQRRNVQSEELGEIEAVIETKEERQITRFGLVQVKPWIEGNLPYDLWWSGGLRYALKYSDLERANRSGQRGVFTTLGKNYGSTTGSLNLKYDELFDSENAKTVSLFASDAGMVWEITDIFELDLLLTNVFYQYTDDTLDGPTSLTGIEAEFANNLPLGLRLGLRGGAAYISENIVHNLPTYEVASANGTSYTGKLYISFAPAPIFNLSLYEIITRTKYSVEPAEAQDVYEQNTHDYSQEFGATASINLLF